MTPAGDRLIGIADLTQIIARDPALDTVSDAEIETLSDPATKTALNTAVSNAVDRALSAGMRNLILRTKQLPTSTIAAVHWPAIIDQIHAAHARPILHDSLLYAMPELLDIGAQQHWSAAILKAQAQQIPQNTNLSTGKTGDRPSADARSPRLRSADTLFGVSAHSAHALSIAETCGAAWAFVSPFGPTASKPGYGPPLDVPGTRALCQRTSLPVFALGGIHPGNVADVASAGVSGAVVMGMLTNPHASIEIKALLEQMEKQTWMRQTPWSS